METLKHDWQDLIHNAVPQQVPQAELRTDGAVQEEVSCYLPLLQEAQRSIYERAKHHITFSSPMLSMVSDSGEIPFLYPNTVTVISAKTGKHKTRLAELLCSVVLKHPENQHGNHGLLNIVARTSREYAVVYVDTERNLKEQVPYSIQNIKAKAGYDRFADLPGFDYISLVEVLFKPITTQFHLIKHHQHPHQLFTGSIQQVQVELILKIIKE